jgi:hypothetical protein
MRRRGGVALMACLVGLLVPAASSQAVTVGAPLDQPVNLNINCQVFSEFFAIPSCTLWGNDSAGAWTSQTPKGNWTIVRARVRTGPSTGPMVFTVIRALRSQAGAGPLICCSSPVEGPVFTPPPNSIVTVPLNLPVVNTVQTIDGEPIEVVDYLGIGMLDLTSSLPVHEATSQADPAASAGLTYFIPAMREGQEAFEPGSVFGYMPLINADYDPADTTDTPPNAEKVTGPNTPIANAFRLLPGVKILPGGRARLGANVPGPGVLRAASPGGGAASSSALPRSTAKGKGQKPALLLSAKKKVKAAGKAYITVKLSRVGKRIRKREGELEVPVKISFAPKGGISASQRRTISFP